MTFTPGIRLHMPETDERAEWLEWRRQGIGASDVAGIMGKSKWASPWSVWADKMGLTPEAEPTDAMLAGLYAENVIAPMCEERAGLTVHSMQQRCEHPDKPWMRATIDGKSGDDEVLVEMKHTGDSPAEWAEDGIPLHYKYQGAWQCLVTGIPVVVFAVIHTPFGRLSFETYRYEPDPEDLKYIEGRVTDFWNRHVLAEEPPPADGHDATSDAISHVYGHIADADDTLIASRVQADLARLWKRAKQSHSDSQAEVKRLSNLLRAQLGDCSELVDNGELVASWRPQATNRLDVTALRKAHPDIAAEFTNETISRVLRAHDTKGKK